MNNQTPSQVRCGRQPEPGRLAGRLALGLCLRMNSPWLGATLPWQWGWGSPGPEAQPRGAVARTPGALGGHLWVSSSEGLRAPAMRTGTPGEQPCSPPPDGTLRSPLFIMVAVGRGTPFPHSDEHYPGLSLSFLACQMGLLAPPKLGCGRTGWEDGTGCPAHSGDSVRTKAKMTRPLWPAQFPACRWRNESRGGGP